MFAHFGERFIHLMFECAHDVEHWCKLNLSEHDQLMGVDLDFLNLSYDFLKTLFSKTGNQWFLVFFVKV
jgi:hypothetical protein